MHTYYYVLTIKLVVTLITSRLNLSALTTKLVVSLITNSKKACPLDTQFCLEELLSWSTWEAVRATLAATWTLWAHSLLLNKEDL